jgi:hypothetical protein
MQNQFYFPFQRIIPFVVLAVIGLGMMLVSAEVEIEVGHNTANQLVVQIGFNQPLGLPVSVFPGWPGFATGEVGLHSAAADDPAGDFFQLSPAADFRFMLVSKDPGMEVLNDHGSAYMSIGESFFIGTAPFDTHPLWNITNGIAGSPYSITIKVHDLNGVYSDSAPVTMIFTPDPPVLSIIKAAPGFVTLSWAPPTPGFVLQSALAVMPLVWSNAPSGTTNPATIRLGSSAKLFRVKR